MPVGLLTITATPPKATSTGLSTSPSKTALRCWNASVREDASLTPTLELSACLTARVAGPYRPTNATAVRRVTWHESDCCSGCSTSQVARWSAPRQNQSSPTHGDWCRARQSRSARSARSSARTGAALAHASRWNRGCPVGTFAPRGVRPTEPCRAPPPGPAFKCAPGRAAFSACRPQTGSRKSRRWSQQDSEARPRLPFGRFPAAATGAADEPTCQPAPRRVGRAGCIPGAGRFPGALAVRRGD